MRGAEKNIWLNKNKQKDTVYFGTVYTKNKATLDYLAS